mgnify:CR=1 FL=1
MNHKYSNRLVKEQSPYLLQHAHNPVNWYPWGIEALNQAKQENKPILISIGYAACHWCHVMERESFENETVAQYMNEHFINIKVDREERPDLDNIYMEAVQTMTGSGGWPLNCFLTPDARPFYGGTYFPPQQMHNRPSFMMVLQGIVDAFHNKPDVIEKQANQLLYQVGEQDKAFFASSLIYVNKEIPFEKEQAEVAFDKMTKSFDTENGGFGGAPKFPQTMSLQYLLQYYKHTNNQTALNHVILSTDKMIMGGIYDHVGGGFARYTVDKAWLVPHFEKMLYDNALLIGLIADVYNTAPKPLYKNAIVQSLAFIAQEMMHPDGGFYASYDADSEGEEGKYYVWSKSQINAILGEEAIVFSVLYDVTAKGNWEGHNILNQRFAYNDFANRIGYGEEELYERMTLCKKRLYGYRDLRVKPGLDDKMLLNWNALMITAFAKAYQTLGHEAYKTIAEKNMQFILTNFKSNELKGQFLHTYKNGKAKYIAFLDDYANLIEALIYTYQITFNENYLTQANDLIAYVLNNFADDNSPILYYTDVLQTDLVLRKKEFYDNATPSGNASMVHNLFVLGKIFANNSYIERAQDMLKSIETTLTKYPSSFGKWGAALFGFLYPYYEIVVTGKNADQAIKAIQAMTIPNKVLLKAKKDSTLEIIEGKYSDTDDLLIFVCQNQTCHKPLTSINEFKTMLA